MLRPDGKNFSLVVDAFNMRLNKVPLDEIAEHMNKRGYKRTNAKTGRVYSKGITKEKIRRILKDPVYTGVIQYGPNTVNLTEVYDFVPAVSVEDFMTINKMDKKSDFFKLSRSYKKGEKVRANLLRNKVVCSLCGEEKTSGITSKKNKEGQTNYYYYRCETEGCPLENKSTRAKVIVDFAIDYLNKKPFSNLKSYTHYKDEFIRVAKERVREKQMGLKIKKATLTKAEERIVDLKAAMVLETDETVKGFQKDDFESTTEKVLQLNKDIESIEKSIKSIKGAPMSYEKFLELFDNMAKTITKTSKMEHLDTMLGKIFSNFTVNKKSVEEYTLNEPFASLECNEVSNVSDGAR